MPCPRDEARAWLALEDAICVAFVCMVSCRMFVRWRQPARAPASGQGPLVSRRSFSTRRCRPVDARASSTRRRTGAHPPRSPSSPRPPPHRARATIASTGRDGTLVSHRDRDHRRPSGAVASLAMSSASSSRSGRAFGSSGRARSARTSCRARGRCFVRSSIDARDRRTIGAIVRLLPVHRTRSIQCPR